MEYGDNATNTCAEQCCGVVDKNSTSGVGQEGDGHYCAYDLKPVSPTLTHFQTREAEKRKKPPPRALSAERRAMGAPARDRCGCGV